LLVAEPLPQPSPAPFSQAPTAIAVPPHPNSTTEVAAHMPSLCFASTLITHYSRPPASSPIINTTDRPYYHPAKGISLEWNGFGGGGRKHFGG